MSLNPSSTQNPFADLLARVRHPFQSPLDSVFNPAWLVAAVDLSRQAAPDIISNSVTSPFAHSEAQSGYTLTASPTAVLSETPINVSWTAPSGSSTLDWIGIYLSGADDGDMAFWQYTGGATSGTLQFTAPFDPGAYEFRYFFDDGWDRRATSNTVTVTSNTYAIERLDPANRTGEPSEDLFSGNYNWSLPLLSLPGRAGLDLNLALTYNSLVWTKSGSYIGFDADMGFPAPGFRLGFPIIQDYFTNTQTGSVSYMLITPAGRRVELRQTGTNVYESKDSSYLYLTVDQSAGILTLYATDGTRMKFAFRGYSYQCAEIKDRNGNYITIGYNSYDALSTITDTLGRVVNFNYNTYHHLISITQTWGGATHTWATFGYNNQVIQAAYDPSLIVSGPAYGSSIPVLTRVNLHDGSRWDFVWTRYGQVRLITRYGGMANGRLVTTYNLPATPNPSLTDCPRFTQRTYNVDGWGFNGLRTFAIDRAAGNGQVTNPDGSSYKEFFATSGWQRGLITRTENKDEGGVLRKYTTIDWTQDNTGVTYPLNPRAGETNIYDDAGNRRRTTTQYTANYGLPQNVREYDGTTLLRRTQINYELGSNYISTAPTRRIIGLPTEVCLYEGESALASKVKYLYDETAAEHLVNQGTAVRHDSAAYTDTFRARGNVTSTQRWDVTAPTDANKAVTTKTGYNTHGSVIFQREPKNSETDTGNQTDIAYTDNYSDGVNRNTWAYPTRVTDPDGRLASPQFYSEMQYRFDIGKISRTKAPHRQEDATGSPVIPAASVAYVYDNAGRIDKITNEASCVGSDCAQTRYVYSAELTDVMTYSKIQEGQGEFFSSVHLDGFDQVIETAKDHPTSVGGYSIQYFHYDQMRRLVEQSKPTEATSTGQAAGDDVAGYIYTTQTYDWQGRPRITTYPDAYNSTKQVSYSGCGCAGGQVVTTTDEVGRKQDQTFDVLGRLRRTRTYESNGTTVYATTISAYNVRDQLETSTARAGAAETGAGQVTTMTYDGHGRLQTRKYPIESTATTYAYNPDDTVLTATDPRGIVATYGYNRRKLITSVDYMEITGVPSADVTITYDELGNRDVMNDGPGQVDYKFNRLSQIVQEKRNFDDLAQSYTLKYKYNLAGQVKEITDPWDASVGYVSNKAGEITEVTGVGYKDLNQWTDRTISQFAINIKYRAWGATKSFSNQNAATEKRDFTLGYDARLRLTQFNSGGRATVHSYFKDSNLKDVTDSSYSNFNREYTYDHVGRLKTAKAGTTAPKPYDFTFAYNEWNNTASRTGGHWTCLSPNFSASYVNDRNTYMQYDEAGNMIRPNMYSSNTVRSYDSANRLANIRDLHESVSVFWNTSHGYDGDGRQIRYAAQPETGSAFGRRYSIKSTVLGGREVATVWSNENYTEVKENSYVYLHGEQIAFQSHDHPDGGPNGEDTMQVIWVYQNPIIGSRYEHNRLNYDLPPTDRVSKEVVVDPLGNNVETTDPCVPPTPPEPPPGSQSTYGDISNFDDGCILDGIDTPCDVALRLVNSGAATVNLSSSNINALIQRGITPILEPIYVPGENGDGGGYVPGYRFNFGLQRGDGQRPPLAPIPKDRVAGGGNPSPCAYYLGELFGAPGSVMAVDYNFAGYYRGYTPEGAEQRRRDIDSLGAEGRQARRQGGGYYYDNEHLYWYPHLYGNEAATSSTDIYVPSNYTSIRKVSDSTVAISYKQLGGYSDVTLAVMHVADYGVRRIGGRTRIGRIGGEGGTDGRGGNIHSHFQLWRGGRYLPPGDARDAASLPLPGAFCAPPSN